MKTLNEEMKKMKRLFDYKKGEVITESEDKECDCGNEPCTCVEGGHYIGEDSEGEETFNYGSAVPDGEWHPSWDGELSSKEEFLTTKRNIQMMLRRLTQTILTSKHTVEDMDYIFHVEQTLMDLMDEINLEALEGDMSYDEDHEDRDEEGTDFSESKKYSKVLKTLSESQVKTLKRFVSEGLLSDNAKEAKDNKIESIIKQLRRLSNTIDSTGDNMKPSKINDLLHGVENGIMEKLESIEELLYKQSEKVKEVKK